MQNLANQLPYAFLDIKKVIKSHIPTANALALINVLERQLVNESKIRIKPERSIDSIEITPCKRRTQRKIGAPKEVNIEQKVHVEAYDKRKAPIKAYGEKKAPTKAYGEQEAPVEAYIKQETLEKVRDKEIAYKRHRYLKIMSS